MSDFDPTAGQPHDDRIPTGPDSFPEAGPHSVAGVGQRLLARLVDSAILGLPVVLLLVSVIDAEADPNTVDISTGVVVALLALTVLYETVFVAWKGQTPGKMAIGIRVARFSDGETPLWSAAGIRALLPTVASVLPFGLGLLGLLVYLSILWDHVRRGWHDKAAGTVVVRTR